MKKFKIYVYLYIYMNMTNDCFQSDGVCVD